MSTPEDHKARIERLENRVGLLYEAYKAMWIDLYDPKLSLRKTGLNAVLDVLVMEFNQAKTDLHKEAYLDVADENILRWLYLRSSSENVTLARGDKVFLNDVMMPSELLDQYAQFMWRKQGQQNKFRISETDMIVVYLDNLSADLPRRHPLELLMEKHVAHADDVASRGGAGCETQVSEFITISEMFDSCAYICTTEYTAQAKL